MALPKQRYSPGPNWKTQIEQMEQTFLLTKIILFSYFHSKVSFRIKAKQVHGSGMKIVNNFTTTLSSQNNRISIFEIQVYLKSWR